MVRHTVSNSLLISHVSEQWEFFWMHWRYSKYYWRLLGLFLWLHQPAAITWYSLSSRKHVKMFILLCFWKIKTKEIFDKEIYSMRTQKWLVCTLPDFWKKYYRNTKKTLPSFKKCCQIIEKTLPKCKKTLPILLSTTRFLEKHYRNAKNTTGFLEKHYWNSKNTTNITPCGPPVLSDLQGVYPLYPLF